MNKELNKDLMKLSELEIQSVLRSNRIERGLRKEIYALYTGKRMIRLTIELLPLIVNLGVASILTGMVQKVVNKTLEKQNH